MIIEEYRLGEKDLEAESGDPHSIEQPKEIVPRPLSMENQDDRVRMVFGLTSDDLLPNPDERSLETYYAYLDKRMSFPFEARQYENDDWFAVSAARWIKVAALGREPDDLDEDDGIFCEVQTAEGEDLVPLADLKLRRSGPNRQLVDDYGAWFLGELVYEDDYCDEGDSFDDDDEPDEDDDPSQFVEETTWGSVALTLAEITAFAASYGAVVGSAVVAMPWAKWGACIGGGVWGIIVALAAVSSSHEAMPHLVVGFRKWLAGAIGLFNGAVQGAFYGIAAVAFAGALAGGIAGLVFRRLLGGKKRRFLSVLPRKRSVRCGLWGGSPGVLPRLDESDRRASVRNRDRTWVRPIPLPRGLSVGVLDRPTHGQEDLSRTGDRRMSGNGLSVLF